MLPPLLSPGPHYSGLSHNSDLVQRFHGTNHIDFIPQPRPEERALARVSKDGHRRDRACGHPSRRPRKERGLLRMRSVGVGGTRVNLPRRLFLRSVLPLAAGAPILPSAWRNAAAQAFPARPLTMVVPFPAAGPADVLA